MSRAVALVIVSHSAKLAQGVVELSSQMAPDVDFFPAGGMDDGGLGTSFDKIEKAILDALNSSQSAVVLTDLGSATMTSESVIEMLEEPQRVMLADGPLVEGAIAAGVAAQQNQDMGEVKGAVEEAAAIWDASRGEQAKAEPGMLIREVVIADAAGLHARPAAKLATLAGTFDAEILVDDTDARSVLGLMSLGKNQGDTVVIKTSGTEAQKAMREIGDGIEAGFDN
jgi:Phosphotransferase System HPr (HPr) Family